jgi:hypothetical protein
MACPIAVVPSTPQLGDQLPEQCVQALLPCWFVGSVPQTPEYHHRQDGEDRGVREPTFDSEICAIQSIPHDTRCLDTNSEL